MKRMRVLFWVLILVALPAAVAGSLLVTSDGAPVLDTGAPVARIPLPRSNSPNHAPGPENTCAFTVVSSFHDRPIARASVVVRLSGQEAVTYATDAWGRARVETAGPGPVSLHVEAPGFHPHDAQVDRNDATPMFVRLHPAAVIRGQVVDSLRTPQAGAWIQAGVLWKTDTDAIRGEPWPLAEPIVTDEKGGFTIANVDPRGRYLLVASLSRRAVGHGPRGKRGTGRTAGHHPAG